jgi:hypothetical protein
MMGTLATLMAGKKIPTPESLYWTDAKECFSNYIAFCPAAQSVIGCIKIEDELCFEK